MKGYIHSIDTFGTVDGPGIRFVLFLQGCPMRCKYCHNPDTLQPNIGKQMSVDEILAKYKDCKEFLRNGGITATGGEPLMQMEFVTELFTACKERGIHTCLDTSGITFTPAKKPAFDKLMAVTDIVMLDIKHIDSASHKELTGHRNENILEFAEYLCSISKPTWVRHVVVPGITLDENALDSLGYYLGNMSCIKALDILPYHKMGESKYKALGLPVPLENTPNATKDDAKWARDIITAAMKRRLSEKETV